MIDRLAKAAGDQFAESCKRAREQAGGDTPSLDYPLWPEVVRAVLREGTNLPGDVAIDSTYYPISTVFQLLIDTILNEKPDA